MKNCLLVKAVLLNTVNFKFHNQQFFLFVYISKREGLSLMIALLFLIYNINCYFVIGAAVFGSKSIDNTLPSARLFI